MNPQKQFHPVTAPYPDSSPNSPTSKVVGYIDEVRVSVSPLRMRVGPDGLLVPELPVTAPNVPRSRGRRVAAGMTVLFLGWAALDFTVGRLVPLPDGVGGCLMACGLACSLMGLLWAQGVHKR